MSKRNPLLGDPYPIRKGIQNTKRRPRTIGHSASGRSVRGSDGELGISPDPKSDENLREIRRKSGPVY